MDSSSSAVVIGAGIAGAATAFALARRGVAVTIVDDGRVGQATAASAGIIQPWSSGVEGPFYDLYAAGAAHYPTMLAELAAVGVTRTDHRRSGALVVNADPALLDATEARVRARQATAGDVVGSVDRIANREARSLFPPLAEGLDALFIGGGGRVDGRTLRDALLDAAVRLGAVRLVARVASVVPDREARGAVLDDGSVVTGDALVIAAGAWTNALLERQGVAVPVAPQRGQITHLRVEGVDTSAWPSVHPIAPHYLVAFDDSRVAVGATRETGSGFDPRVTAAGVRQTIEDALRVAPGLADATLIETRVGLRPLPEGALPVVGALPGHDGVFVATGYGAAGLTMGPLLGDALARAVLGEAAPELAAVAPGAA